MRKNVAGQHVAFQMVSTSDGSAVTTGSPTVYVTIDGGTQSTGSGTSTHKGNGCWDYAPTQGETNGDHVAFTMALSGAVSQTVNMIPKAFNYTASDLGLNNLSAADVKAEADQALTDYDPPTKTELDNGLAALNDPTAASIASAVWGDTQSSYSTSGTFGFLLDTAISSVSAPSAADVADAVWDEPRSGHTSAGSFGEGVLVEDLNTTAAATVNAQADQALTDYDPPTKTELDNGLAGLNDPTASAIASAVWSETQSGYTTSGTFGYFLDSAVSGVSTGGVSAADIADAVWDEARADHTAAGSFGEGVLVEDLNTTAAATVNAQADQALTDYDPPTKTELDNGLAGLNDPTAAAIASAVWGETQSGYSTVGTFGYYLDAAVSGVSTGGVSAADIADAVWDEARADHTAAGSFGEGVLVEDLNTTAEATVNAQADQAITDANLVATSDLPTNFGDLAITATTGLVSAGSLAADSVDANALATDAAEEIADAWLDRASAIDGYTPREALRVMSAALFGVLAGANTTSVTIEAVDGSKTRITATVDEHGNRSLVTVDET